MKVRILCVIALCWSCLATESLQAGGDHAWHAAVFTGLTNNFDAEHTDLTVGVDIMRKLSDEFSVGIAVEDIFADHNEIILLGLASYAITQSWNVFAGPGLLFIDGVDGNELLLRLGSSYMFHSGNLSFGPVVDGDLVDGHFLLVYGLGLGVGF